MKKIKLKIFKSFPGKVLILKERTNTLTRKKTLHDNMEHITLLFNTQATTLVLL